MSLIAAAKCCQDCARTENPDAKTSIRDYMFGNFQKSIGEVETQCENGVADIEDVAGLRFFIRQLEVECLYCDGTKKKIFLKIEEGHGRGLKKELEEIIKKSEDAAEKKKRKMKKGRGFKLLHLKQQRGT